MTLTISTAQVDAIQIASEVLDGGGIIAFPTDTVYGLAARVNDPAAIEKLFWAKGRDFNKAIAVLVGERGQVDVVAASVPKLAQTLMKNHWPGALTLVLPKNEHLPEVLSPLPTVGVRMPDHPFALKLLRAVGPLATTSANRSGGENPITARDVLEQLSGRVDLILDGGVCPGGVPSTLLDCTGETPVLLRLGALTEWNVKDEDA